MALQKKTFSTGNYSYLSWSNSYVISLTLTEESVDAATNTSLVSYLFTISNTDNNRFISYDYSWKISIGGQEIAINHLDFELGKNFTTQTIAQGQLRIRHTGTPMAFSVSIPNLRAQNQYGPPAMTLSGTWDLTFIPNPSQVSCPGGTIGQNAEITIAKADPSFTHTLTYAFGNLTGTIVEKTAFDTFSWLIPEKFFAAIPESKQEKCTTTCTSYAGDVVMGSSTCWCYVGVDSQRDKPQLRTAVEDINETTLALTGNKEVLVRYCSSAMVGVEVTPSPGASIAEGYMMHNGERYTIPNIVEQVQNGVFKIYAKDSRGLSTAEELTPPIIPYIKLTCSLSDNKPDGEGNMTVHASGNCFVGSFGAVDNTLSVEYRYKPQGGEYGEWVSMPVTLGARSYNGQVQLTGLDYKTAYTFQVRATDKLGTVYSPEYTARAVPVFDWDENDFNVNGTFKINDTPMADFVVKTVQKDGWCYRNWDSGVCELWGTYTAEAVGGDNVWQVRLPVTLADAGYVVNVSAAKGAIMLSKLGIGDFAGNEGREPGKITVFAISFEPYDVALNIHILGRWK